MSSNPDVVIVDCGLGNVGSIQNMLKRIGAGARPSADPAEIRRAPRLILPGVGSFDAGMERLNKVGLTALLTELAVEARVPILGICLGMQLMARRSEEGAAPGLGWIQADVRRFNFSGNTQKALKVPHMGWNAVAVTRPTPLIDPAEETRFYFVHSYHVCCDQKLDVLATTTYGTAFTSMFQVDNITGVQFHPEKSHQFGMALFEKWLKATVPAPRR